MKAIRTPSGHRVRAATLARLKIAHDAAVLKARGDLRTRIVDRLAEGDSPDGFWADMLRDLDARRALEAA